VDLKIRVFAVATIVSLLLTTCRAEEVEVTRSVSTTQMVVETATGTDTPVHDEIDATVTPTTMAAPSTEFKAPDPETFTFANGASILTLDPNLAYQIASAAVILNVAEALIFFDHKDATSYVPLLATEVPSLENGGISADGLTYTFKIRQGVTFHQGGDLTPGDFEYTFERGLLQSDPNGPQWLLLEPLLGYTSGDVTEEIADGAYAGDPVELKANATPEELLATCQKVKAAIASDDEAWTLTFHLAQPWGPFLATLVGTWGVAIDKEWAIENGAWDGSCDTWQHHYAPGTEHTELGRTINGTGPYKLDHWTPGEEWVLVANEAYWRQPGDAIWPGGPSGPPKIKRVVHHTVTDWGTRLAMLHAGDAESVAVPPANQTQVEALVGEVCNYLTDQCRPHPEHPEAPLRHWPGLPQVSRSDIFMNFNVKTGPGGENLYIGSGKLDGDGIPPDFFSDIHVRRAFNYCFDYDTFVQDVQNGAGVRNNGPIIVGMLGYNPDGPMYEYDPEKCAAELAQAWDGRLPDTGFRVQLAFGASASAYQTGAEILQSSLRTINPKYQLEPLGLAWPAMIEAFRAGQLPLAFSGWTEDIHDPHNWATPYTVGTFARRMSFPDDLVNQFQELVTAGVTTTDPKEREKIYFELQRRFHEQALVVIAPQTADAFYEQRWVQGFYYNPLMLTGYIYAYSLAQ
jgi:peptide/nickel transport system substrate-binding protein